MDWWDSFKEGAWGIVTLASGGLISGGILGEQPNPYAAAQAAAWQTGVGIVEDPGLLLERPAEIIGETVAEVGERVGGGLLGGLGVGGVLVLGAAAWLVWGR